MIDSCQEKKLSAFLFISGKKDFYEFLSRPLVEAGSLKRRLIALIFAGWLPHDLASSRSCLSLKSEVRLFALFHSPSEDSPNRDRASANGLEVKFCSL